MPDPDHALSDTSVEPRGDSLSTPSRTDITIAVVSGLVAAALVAAVLVVGTAIQQGVPNAMRAATNCVMPVGAAWLLSFATTIGLLMRKRFAIALLAMLVFVAIQLIGNGRVASAIFQPLEWPRTTDPLAQDATYRCAVVLGGGVSLAPDGAPELGRDGQRVALGAQLWHAGKVDAVICTGTSVTDDMDPSETGRAILESVGVPGSAIFEVSGQNTFEEMKSLREFLSQPPEGFPDNDRDVVLVTSAFHMPRAMRLAESRGLSLVPMPCCFRVGKAQEFSPADLIPSAGAVDLFSLGAKEWLARMLDR